MTSMINKYYHYCCFGVYLAVCAILPIWHFPFAPAIAIFGLLGLSILLYTTRPSDLLRTAIRWPLFVWVFIMMWLYWVINFLLIAHVPTSEWLTTNFLSEDGKIFFAYLPIFIVPILFSKLSQRASWGLVVFMIVIVSLAGLAITQYYFEFLIPGFSQRQQLVLFGGEIGRALLAGLRQQNAAAALLLLPASLAVCYGIFSKSRWRLWSVPIAAILVWAIVLTISRSGVIGLAVSITTILAWLILNKPQYGWLRKITIFVMATAAIYAALLISVNLVPSFRTKVAQVETASTVTSSSIAKRPVVQTSPSANLNTGPTDGGSNKQTVNEDQSDPSQKLELASNLSSRLTLWSKALDDVIKAPLFGIGLTRYNDIGASTLNLAPGLVQTVGGHVINNDAHAHNSFLHLWAETGTVGLLLFISYYLLLLKHVYGRLSRATNAIAKTFHLAILSSLLGLIAASLFEHNLAAPSVMFGYTVFWGFYALSDHKLFGGIDNSPPSNNLRLLWLSHRANMGGAEKVLLSYLTHSKISRDRIRVVTLEEGPLVDQLRQLGYQVEVMLAQTGFVNVDRQQAGLRIWLRQAMALPYLIWQLAAYVRSERIDLIIGNSTKADLIGAIVARLCGKPFIVRLHDTIEVGEFNRKTYYLLMLIFTYGVDHFLSVSHIVDQSLAHMGIPPSRRHVIYNGIEFRPSPKGLSILAKHKGPTVAILSRLIRHKGQHQVIKIWPEVLRQHPQAKLFIVGAGLFDNERYDVELEKLVADMNLGQSVVFTGFIQDISAIQADADLVIQPSLNPDPLPTALIEAIAQGTYVIASNAGGSKEIILDQSLGQLYSPDDTQTLAKYINNRLANLQAKLSNAKSLAKFKQRFSIEAYVDTMDQAITQIGTKHGT